MLRSCCTGSASVCSDWKTRNAKEGGIFTNWCAFPGQICTANGTLLRLDMRGFNLQCSFPASDFAVFTSLTTLNLGRNPNMTVFAPRPFCLLSRLPSGCLSCIITTCTVVVASGCGGLEAGYIAVAVF